MKFVILATLVASCMCWPFTSWESSHPTTQENFQPTHTKFEVGNEYIYDYESQVLTGLPTFSKQYAGIKMICQVKLDINAQDWWTMQLQNIKLYSMNDEVKEINNLPPFRQLSLDHFNLIDQQSELILQKLRLPIQLRYVDGKIVSMKVVNQETNWSINLKRSVLSMLQVKLQSKSPRMQFNSLDDGVTTFDVLEPGMEGACYSTLHCYADETNGQNGYKVIKVRDQQKCRKVNKEDKNAYGQHQNNCDCSHNMDGKPCECESVSNTWNPSVNSNNVKTEYDLLSDDAQQFLIKKVLQTVESRMEAPHTPSKHILTVSNQTLVLISHKSIDSQRKPTYSWKFVAEPWKMQVMRDEEEKPMMTREQIVDYIQKGVEEIDAISTDPKRLDDHMTIFYQLSSRVRLCKHDELEQLFEEFRKDGISSRKMKVFIDQLKSVNTTQADNFLLQKIVSGDIKAIDAVSVFLQWTAEKVPYISILDQMHRTVLPSLQSNPAKKVLYNHAMLCFGSMVRRYILNEEIKMSQCAMQADKNFHQDNINNCRTYEKYVEGRLSMARKDEEKITALKTLANMGDIKSLPLLVRYLAKSESTAVRLQAINAFRNLGYQNKMKVLEVLMPIMLHHHEETELRVAAFVITMKCESAAPLLELQKHLNREENLEFKTFVVKYMKNMLENEHPRNQQMQMKIRQTLKTIRAFHMSEKTTDWQLKYGAKYCSDMLRIATVTNSSSRIPRYASVKQYLGVRQQQHQFLEFGFSSSGLEALKNPKLKLNQKPSLTLYVKVLGQEISYIHIDESMMYALQKMVESRSGSMEIPVSFFNTMLLRPLVVRNLQPNGAWLVNEQQQVVVVDIEGVLKIELANIQQLPVLTFKSTRQNMRMDMKTMYEQRVEMGFVETGITSRMLTRGFSNAQQTVLSYDLQQKNFVANYTNAGSLMEFLAVSETFVLPTRLPIMITSKSQISKELQVDDSEKRLINRDINFLKSLQLAGRVEGEVNMPDWYTMVRDKMNLLPTLLPTYKQHLRLHIKPLSAETTKICTRFSSRFVPANEACARQSKMESSQMEDNDSFLSFLWKDDQQKSEPWTENAMEKLMEPSSLGSLCHVYDLSLATITNMQVLNMTAKATTFYQHNEPTTRTTIKVVRPPIPGQEQEQFVYQNFITSTVNPGRQEILIRHNMNWGAVSNPQDSSITVTYRLRPHFKDNVCHQLTAYGCKDDFGVIYPVWYNNTLDVTYEKNDIPIQIRKALETYLMNNAESVYMYPNEAQQAPANSMHLNFIVRPMESKVDFIVRDRMFYKNMSRVYVPVAIKVHQYITENRYPVDSINFAVSNIGLHSLQQHRINPFVNNREFCVYAYPKVYTFDKKELSVALTGCEIALASNCGHQATKVEVIVTPEADMTTPKKLQVTIGNKLIEILVVRQQSSKKELQVKIDDQTYPAEELKHKPIMNFEEQIATIDCNDDKCELVSSKNGIYINMDMEKVSVETDSKYQCGLCAARSHMARKPSEMNSLNIVKENVINSDQCTHNSISDLPEKYICEQKNKYRLVNDFQENKKDMLKCVTEKPHPMCSDSCSYKPKKIKVVKARCITDKTAKDMGLSSSMLGDEKIIEDQQMINKIISEGVKREVQIHVSKSCN